MRLYWESSEPEDMSNAWNYSKVAWPIGPLYISGQLQPMLNETPVAESVVHKGVDMNNSIYADIYSDRRSTGVMRNKISLVSNSLLSSFG